MRVIETGNKQGRVGLIVRGVAVLVLAVLAGAGANRAGAQVLYGTITGEVTDPTGADIPNAKVTVTNQANGETRQTTTAGHGEYTVPNLEPGPYTISIAPMASFGGYTQKNVAVEVNSVVRVNAALQPASVNAEVTVDTSAPILQTETAEVNHQISQTELAQLPITSSQGRNFQSLYSLIPGTTNVQENNSTAGNPARSFMANVNGISANGNTTRIDGAINDYGWLPYLVAYIPPADGIETVNFTTNSFNAEQGVAGGASINVILKSGTNALHGSAWEYNQLSNVNARGYTITQAAYPRIPKNIYNEFGFSIGGPVYIPKILTGKSKLFFFQDFDRTTRRQLLSGLDTVVDTKMLSGDFSEVAGLAGSANGTLYDPQPPGLVCTPSTCTNGYLNVGLRPTFMSEYGCNCIPASRQFPGSAKMAALLQPISSVVGTPTPTQLNNQLFQDYPASGTFAYNRNASDSKVTYNPSDRTSLFGHYSIQPFSALDPQPLGGAGGAPLDGGQPGAAAGRMQNVGIDFSHVITSRLVVDADGGYTRQVTGAQSVLDIADGDFGLNTLGIPGTNGIGPNYVGQPVLAFYGETSSGAPGLSTLGNAQTANPFLFRDNQFTADINVSWNLGKHSTKYGFTYYHFDLNHFQPTGGGAIVNPRGGFYFQGGMTTNSTSLQNSYLAFADFLLGLPNYNGNPSVQKAVQLYNPNSMRWTELAAYAQDQWQITPRLTLNYGARYEFYPVAYRDHSGIYRLDPTLPQSGNVIIGGVNGNPESAGVNVGWGQIVPRLGIAYRVTDRLVVRTGGGITSDPDSMRFLRDSYPMDQAPSFSGSGTDTIAVNAGQALPLSVGIPTPVLPNVAAGIVSLPVSGSTNTLPANYRRGYIESWNLFVEQDLGSGFVANIGYVGTHEVRQPANYTLNSAPLPSGSSVCMANGQFNPSSPYYNGTPGTNPCNSAANETINIGAPCPAGTTGNAQGICYNTGGITMNAPTFSSNYNALQSQLSRRAGRLAQYGLIYTWSHAFDFDDNGAGSGSTGPSFAYPAYWSRNRASAGYDRTNNLQFWWIYHLPWGRDQRWANHGVASAIFGGFQVNGQLSHVSGAPFSVSASTNALNAPGNAEFADLVKPYRQLSGHARGAGSNVTGGNTWFDTTAFANPVEPTNSATAVPGTIVSPHFGNTHRNEFRGPGVTQINASIFRGFHIWRESEFQLRAEAFNVLNHALLNNPNATVGGSTFGYITSFGAPYSPTAGTRTLQFSGRFNF
ncbi:MAG TPA: TonB-dependent receptor [Acidobacteriaceae bacterium]|nr:TonB-dependent receptor [Acidobacteriaceae bacterium]